MLIGRIVGRCCVVCWCGVVSRFEVRGLTAFMQLDGSLIALRSGLGELGQASYAEPTRTFHDPSRSYLFGGGRCGDSRAVGWY